MNAREIVRALAGQWHGTYGTARCPAHDDQSPSLSVADGADDRALVYCFAGCPFDVIRDALVARGLWPDRDYAMPPARHAPPERTYRDINKARRSRLARDLWRASHPIANTLGEFYLRSRGLLPPWPPTLRYSANTKHGPTSLILPAMIAAVTHWPEHEVAAVHRTFLTAGHGSKASVTQPKMMLGPCAGGAVRLTPATETMAVAEGVETGLSAIQACGLSVWAALSTSGLRALVLPPLPLAREVIILADNDANGAGQAAAEKAARRWTAEGRSVRIALPPTADSDFNDMLADAAETHSSEVAA